METMDELKVAAIAQVTMHQRERTVILRPYQGGLTLHTLYYPNEIREVAGYGKNKASNLKKPEITLAEQFAKGLIEPFRPEQYHDEYQERVKKLVASKHKGTAAPKPEKTPRLAPVVDLMTALKQSIANKGARAKAPSSDHARHSRARKSA
jgi:DNA end-binding protein Ku